MDGRRILKLECRGYLLECLLELCLYLAVLHLQCLLEQKHIALRPMREPSESTADRLLHKSLEFRFELCGQHEIRAGVIRVGGTHRALLLQFFQLLIRFGKLASALCEVLLQRLNIFITLSQNGEKGGMQ